MHSKLMKNKNRERERERVCVCVCLSRKFTPAQFASTCHAGFYLLFDHVFLFLFLACRDNAVASAATYTKRFMSTKKKYLKGLQSGGAVTEEASAALTAALNSNLRYRDKEFAARPAQSRMVNLNCLRPHGVLQEGDFRSLTKSPETPESLLEDIALMVNASQILLRRSPDFQLITPLTDAVDVLGATAFRQKWIDTVAATCRSAMAYPFTEFRFLSPLPRGYSTGVSVATEGEEVQRCTQAAETIQRILRVFVKASNSGQWQFEQLLYHVLRNEKKSAEGLVSVNYNSRHITVCCGLFYYRVEVLDEDGFVLDTVMITERLWAVRQHADRNEREIREHKLLPDAREDLFEFYQLLGSLTEIDGVECAAVWERLKNAEPANAASLVGIDTGIFTVILRTLDNKSSSARWYRSALVLEEKEEKGVMAVRGHSILIYVDDLLEFLMRVLCLDDAAGGVSDKNNKEGESLSAGSVFNSDGNLPPGVEHLDLWLPWKHRKPMRPYAVVKPPPHVFPLSISKEDDIPFAYLCMAAVLAVHRVLTPFTEFPTVLVAFPNRRGDFSAALMYSYEVEEFIRSLCGGSALVERRAKSYLLLQAVQSLAGIIDACFHETYPKYSMAKLLLKEGKAMGAGVVADNAILGTVDLYVTVGMLDPGKKVLDFETSVLLPSRFALMCTASGKTSHNSSTKCPSDAHLIYASLKVSEGNEETSMGAQLAECITEKIQELRSLVFNGNFM
ncbi:hypothetical protein MOQ_001259 [Trypanosoma cruzi marinkellei]|uniref:Choline/carnitine acyltransferase domain-containing protein n=1 Tax=Trypanosoma cruzi marinkellei TaxID=85056 RepID=K2NGP1_TRYCR|nr:hypothetical protein MOQ_001259 [Trypanosoma cruzi marinkellei]